MADQEIAGLVVKMKADLSDYTMKLAQMERETTKTSDNVALGFKKITTALAAAGVAVGGFAATAINSAMSWGEAVDDLVDKTGMAGEQASELLAIGKRAGLSTDLTNAAFGKLSKTINNAATEMSKANLEGKNSDDVLTRLGISAMNTDGSMRSTVDIFKDIKNALSGMDDGWQKTALEMELFGRSGFELHDMLNMTDAEIQATIDKARELGLLFSTENAAAWEQFRRDLNSTKATLSSIGATIGNEMLPELREMLSTVQDVAKAYVGLDADTKSWINSVIKLTAEVGLGALAINGLTRAAEACGIAAAGAAGPWMALVYAIGMATKAAYDFGVQTQDNYAKKYGEFYSGSPELNDGFNSQSTGPGGDFGQRERGGWGSVPASMRSAPELPKPKISTPFIGGGNSGGNSGGSGSVAKEKSELDQYLNKMRETIAYEEKRLELGHTTRQEFDQMLYDQYQGLEAVSAGEDEEAKKQTALLDIDIRHMKLKQEQQRVDQVIHDKKIEEIQDEGKAIDAVVKAEIEAAKEKENAMQRIKEKNASTLADLISGTRSAHDVLREQWREFVQQVIMEQMKMNGISNIFSSILGGLFGGGGRPAGVQGPLMQNGSFYTRASGGPVSDNTPYIIGEQGPELFMPNVSGYVVPNSQLSGAGAGNVTVSINQNFAGQQDASVVAQIKAAMPYIKSEIKNAIRTETSMRSEIKGVR